MERRWIIYLFFFFNILLKLLCFSQEFPVRQNLFSSKLQGWYQKKGSSKWSVYKKTYKNVISFFHYFFFHFTEWFNPSRWLHARRVQSVLKQPLPSTWNRPHLFWVVRKDTNLFIFSPSLIFWVRGGSEVGYLVYSTMHWLRRADFNVNQEYCLT